MSVKWRHSFWPSDWCSANLLPRNSSKWICLSQYDNLFFFQGNVTNCFVFQSMAKNKKRAIQRKLAKILSNSASEKASKPHKVRYWFFSCRTCNVVSRHVWTMHAVKSGAINRPEKCASGRFQQRELHVVALENCWFMKLTQLARGVWASDAHTTRTRWTRTCRPELHFRSIKPLVPCTHHCCYVNRVFLANITGFRGLRSEHYLNSKG